MMLIVANGKPREIPDEATVQSFLESLGWRAEWVVVEWNGEPLERSRYPQARLAPHDRLEVVRAVAGGAR